MLSYLLFSSILGFENSKNPWEKIHVLYFVAPCGLSGRFEDGNFSLLTKMKIRLTLYWRWRCEKLWLFKVWKLQTAIFVGVKIAFWKLRLLKIRIPILKYKESEYQAVCMLPPFWIASDGDHDAFVPSHSLGYILEVLSWQYRLHLSWWWFQMEH